MIATLIDGLLTHGTAGELPLEAAFERALQGELSDAQLAGFLVALRTVPPTPELLVAAVRAIRARQCPFPETKVECLDTCGTGGDGLATFNVSTAAALVTAAAGVAVAKHGNRSVSSSTGSADVLEALGIPIDSTPEDARASLEQDAFCFLFARDYHPTLSRVAGVRRELGVRTIFNLLGPLLNPTLARRQVIGVYDAALTEVVARALSRLGTERALVVHCGGLDELGLHAPTTGHEVCGERVLPFRLDPRALGLESASPERLRVADAHESADVIRTVLANAPGPATDIVALNAGAALYVAGRTGSVADGLGLARETLARGAARELLERLGRKIR